MTKKYPVLFEWGGKNFSGYAPDVPGCIATARTLPKMRESLRKALEAHLKWMQKDGEVLPEPSQNTTVDMAEDPEFPNPPGYFIVIDWLTVTMPRVRTRRTTQRKQSSRELVAA